MAKVPISPYLMEEQPTSPGRLFLPRAFAHWCMVHHGLGPDEVAAGLDPASQSIVRDRRDIAAAARLLGELAASRDLKTFARPYGAGTPAPLPAETWERDDFRPMFRHGALDPSRVFDDAAEPTHWIFFDLDDFNRILELSCGEIERPPEQELGQSTQPAHVQAAAVSLSASGRDHVRMPELERRTGMSRATIYRRIKEGRFPDKIPMAGNISAWRESDVAEWLAKPR